jgi:hypothetical protein
LIDGPRYQLDVIATEILVVGGKAIVFAGFAAVLVWEVDSGTFVMFLANVAPEQALHIRWPQSRAFLGLAQEGLDALDNSNQASGNVHERRSEANLSGAVPPDGLDDADRAHAENIEQTRRMAERAARCAWPCAFWGRSPTFQGTSRTRGGSCRRPCAVPETLAVSCLTSKSAERLDYTAALRYAEVLLRTQPQLSNAVMPLLARLAENEEAATGVKEMLSGNPPARAQFFDALPNSITDARTLLDLLIAVKHSPVPPAAVELNSYLNFIAARIVIPA